MEEFQKATTVADQRQLWIKYNEKLERLFTESRDDWNSKVAPLYTGIIKSKPENITSLEASALGLRQNITEEIAYFSDEKSKKMEESREIRKNKILEYNRPGTQPREVTAALNSRQTDRKVLMSGELAFLERTVEMYNNHLQFLIDTRDTLKSFSYTIKNKLEAMDLMINK